MNAHQRQKNVRKFEFI